MDVFEAINNRRSIRKFDSKRKVSDADVKSILSAAMMAPSAGNEQPWHFIVVRDKKILKDISVINPYAAMAKDADLAILIAGDTSLERFKGLWIQDCSAAVQNLLLAAHAKGLGAVWTGIAPVEERIEGFSKLFNLPNNVIPFALIPVGYPADNPKSELRYKEDRVHKNKW